MPLLPDDAGPHFGTLVRPVGLSPSSSLRAMVTMVSLILARTISNSSRTPTVIAMIVCQGSIQHLMAPNTKASRPHTFTIKLGAGC